MSQETIILFIGAVLVAAFVSGTLLSALLKGGSSASTIASSVQEDAVKSFEIVHVHEDNIYIKGLGGELNVANTTVVVNGAPVSFSYTILRDGGEPGTLSPGDLALIKLPVSVDYGDCVFIDVDGSASLWGECG